MKTLKPATSLFLPATMLSFRSASACFVHTQRHCVSYRPSAAVSYVGERDPHCIMPTFLPRSLTHPQNHRLFATAVAVTSNSNAIKTVDSGPADTKVNANATDIIMDPKLVFGELIMPTAFSPSSIMEFKKCPQSFLFQYIYKLKQPTTLVLAKGSMCHEALEKIFDLEPEDRTLEHLQNLLRVSWSEHRLTDTYRFLFETAQTNKDGSNETMRDIAAEYEWGQSALQLLENYMLMEDPRTITRPNPLKREVWVTAHLAVESRLGATGYTAASDDPVRPNGIKTNGEERIQVIKEPATFFVRGIIDRIDMVQTASRQVVTRIVDYKTGKSPHLKYTPRVNERILEETFYQLKIYALLMKEKAVRDNQTDGMDVRFLRLHFLTSMSGLAESLEYDLGETQEERDRILQDVHADMSKAYSDIASLVATQNPKSFVGCDRSFCYCHVCRERFIPGTVWCPQK